MARRKSERYSWAVVPTLEGLSDSPGGFAMTQLAGPTPELMLRRGAMGPGSAFPTSSPVTLMLLR